jgi:hypothetical protein
MMRRFFGESGREQRAYVTYSLSPLFEVRTSGSLPRRPMRMSLDTSDERAGVVENACDFW